MAGRFTSKSLSKAAKLHDTAVRDILNGRSKNPTRGTLSKLETALGLRETELFSEWGRSTDGAAPGPATRRRHGPGAAEAGAPYRSDDRDKRDTAVALTLQRAFVEQFGLKDLSAAESADLLEDLRAVVKRHRP